jgi:hypothetical protein
MELNLSDLDGEAQQINEDKIRIFKEVFKADLSYMNIAQVLKPYFNVSTTGVDDK